MALPDFSMRQLLEAGVHFGHQKHRWNPKMAPYIYGVRNNIHIIDLAQTVPMLHRALRGGERRGRPGGRVLFVGTKRQAAEPITAAAKRSAQYYVNARWLGGMLTNWKTISRSIQRLRELEHAARRRGPGPHQEGAPDAHPRARQAREGARRHQGHGRRARPALRHRHQQGSDRHPGGEPPRHSGGGDRQFQLRSGQHHLSRSRATTMPAAPSRSTATSSPGPRSTASRRAQGDAGIDIGAQRGGPRAGGARGGRRRRRRADVDMTAAEELEPQARQRPPAKDKASAKPHRDAALRPRRTASPTISRRSPGVGRRSRRSSTTLGVTSFDQIAELHRRGHRQDRRGPQLQGPHHARRLGRSGKTSPASSRRRADRNRH